MSFAGLGWMRPFCRKWSSSTNRPPAVPSPLKDDPRTLPWMGSSWSHGSARAVHSELCLLKRSKFGVLVVCCTVLLHAESALCVPSIAEPQCAMLQTLAHSWADTSWSRALHTIPCHANLQSELASAHAMRQKCMAARVFSARMRLYGTNQSHPLPLTWDCGVCSQHLSEAQVTWRGASLHAHKALVHKTLTLAMRR